MLLRRSAQRSCGPETVWAITVLALATPSPPSNPLRLTIARQQTLRWHVTTGRCKTHLAVGPAIQGRDITSWVDTAQHKRDREEIFRRTLSGWLRLHATRAASCIPHDAASFVLREEAGHMHTWQQRARPGGG
jgi:hypothetical protein